MGNFEFMNFKLKQFNITYTLLTMVGLFETIIFFRSNHRHVFFLIFDIIDKNKKQKINVCLSVILRVTLPC